MTTAFADEAVRIHRTAHLPDTLMAEAVGAKPSTVRDWLGGRSSPTGQRARRLAELAEITDRLARVIDRPLHPGVDGQAHRRSRRPHSGRDDRGRPGPEVARLISGLESPGAV